MTNQANCTAVRASWGPAFSWRFSAFLIVGLSLAACKGPAGLRAGGMGAGDVGPQTRGATISLAGAEIHGQIRTTDRQIQAAIGDIASGATIGLSDAQSGQTIATTVSDTMGLFTLTLPSSFTPQEGHAYVLEATKGLPTGGPADRAGAVAGRLRTLLFYFKGNWESLTSASPGGSADITLATTAVAAIANLRGFTADTEATLAGQVDGQVYDTTGTAIGPTEFATVLALVQQALAQDQDPIASLGYDPAGTTPEAQYDLRAPDAIVGTSFSPAVVSPGGTFAIKGQNFPSPGPDVTLWVGEMALKSWSVNPTRTILSVAIPANGYSGWLKIQDGTSVWIGAYLPVHGTVGTLAGTIGTLPLSASYNAAAYIDGAAPFAAINHPTDVAVDASGDVYIASYFDHTIRQLSNGIISTLAGMPGVPGYADGPGSAARFNWPYGLAVDSTGDIYVSDASNYRIRKVTPAGLVSTLAGNGSTGYVDGPGSSAEFKSPGLPGIDASGNLYVPDFYNQVIRKVTPGGVVSTFAGNGSSGEVNGAALSAEFTYPDGVTVDTSGNVFVADTNAHSIREISGGVVSTVAGNGSMGLVNGAAASSEFCYPPGIAVDSSGLLYVGDNCNHAVREISSGTVSTIGGTGSRWYEDGSGSNVGFNSPYGVAVDASGDVFIADYDNNLIREYTP